MFRTLRSRMLAGLLTLSALPALLVAAQGYHCSHEALNDVARRHAQELAAAHRAAIGLWLGEHDTCLATYARLLGASLGPGPEMLAALRVEMDAMDEEGAVFESLALYDETGRALGHLGAWADGLDAVLPESRREAYAAARGAVFDAPGRRGPQHWTVDGGIALSGAEGRIRGFVVARIDLSGGLASLFDSGRVDSGGLRVSLVGLDGRSIVPDGLAAPEAEMQGRGGAKVAHRAIAHKTETPIPGVQLRVAGDAHGTTRWLGVLLYRVGFTLGITLLASAMAALGLSRVLSGPLAMLADVARRIAGGQREARLAPMALAEADEVRQSFNRMMDELRDAEERVVNTATLANVGELTASIVHELRNPLSSVRMNIQALMRWTGQDNVFRELGTIALEQTQRLEVLLESLLQYGRPMAVEPRPVPFRALAEAAVQAAAGPIAQRRVAVRVADDTGGRAIWGEPAALQGALLNLLLNAIQASPEGGTIELHAQSGPGPARSLAVSIRDSGPGLAPEVRARLFQPFFTTKPGGTGLGLANARKVVQLHGGRIEAANALGGGAVFTLHLPAAPAPEAAAALAPA